MAEHVTAPTGHVHIVHNYSYADSATRLAATGFVAADVGKAALQVSDSSFWVLTDDSPITWQPFSSAAFSVNEISAPVFAVDAGANDTYVATLVPAPTAYVAGVHYRFKANTANTGACTINFNGIGAKTIKKAAGGITTDLADNDIRAGQWVDLVYDGTNMQMQSGLGNAPAAGAGGFAASGANADITSMTGLTGALMAPTGINDADSNEVLKFGSTASAVNEVTITNKATGTGPTIAATGGDTDVNLNLVSKGAGVVQANGVSVLLDFVQVAASDETTALTTGTAKITFRMPFAMTVTAVRASLSTTQSSGSIFTVDINDSGTTILSTKLTIDNGEKTSTTAATPAVISDTALADDAEITIDIDQVGDGTAKGLKVTLIGIRG
jgi:hypothetical protein